MTDKPDWNDLLELVAKFDAGDYDNVSVQFGEVSLRMSRTGTLAESTAPARPAVANTPVSADSAPVAEAPAESGSTITAPMIGVFYRQSSPASPPFVEVGQEVTADTTIGIIEIMKLMNPVKAGVAGIIREFAVKDGEAVEFGQLLAVVGAGPS